MSGPRLLDRVRAAIRSRQYSYRTEQAYVHWVRRFILYHGRRHPREMGKREVESFLTHLAVERHVSASTQNQALSAILFLYKAVLEQELEWLDDVVRAKRRVREPVVLTTGEVRTVLAHLQDPYHLMALLMYGEGLRLRECLRLRVKDIDFGYRQITVHDGKGGKDRVTVLPDAAMTGLERQIERARALLAADVPIPLRGCLDARCARTKVPVGAVRTWLAVRVPVADPGQRPALQVAWSATTRTPTPFSVP